MTYCTKCGKPTDNGIMCKDCMILDSPWLFAMKSKEDDLVEQIKKLKSENAKLRKQISHMIMPPCTLDDTLYIVSFCFGDGYDESENVVRTIGWKIFETKVDEKNFYRMCDLVRCKKAFFSKEAAEARLAELKGEKK